MKTVMIPLSDLRRPERNVRMHTDKQIKEFRRSVEMFGQIRPIVVDENNVTPAPSVRNRLWPDAPDHRWPEPDAPSAD